MARQPKKNKKTTSDELVESLNKEIDELVFSERFFSSPSNKKNIQDELWIDEPILTFKDFCSSPEHMNFPPLSERQLSVVDYLLGDNPKKIFDNNRNIALLIWGKGCVVGREEIFTYDGKRMNIIECYKKNVPILVYSLKPSSQEITFMLSTPAILKPEREWTIRLFLENGQDIDVSKDHLVYTNKGWKKAKELTKGKYLIFKAFNYKIPTLYSFDAEKAYFLGLLFSIKRKKDIKIEILKKIAELAVKFNVLIEFRKRGAKRFVVKKEKNVDKEFERLPVELIFGGLDIHIAFLKGFFENGFKNIFVNKLLFKDLDFLLSSYGIYIKRQNQKLVLTEKEIEKINNLINHKKTFNSVYPFIKCKGRFKFKKQMVYTFSVPVFHNYMLSGIFHHNSGKDTISALIQLYIVYVLLHLKNPQAFFGLGPASSIDLLNIASTREQAEQIYFQLLKNFTINWKWLKERYSYVVSGRYFSSPTSSILDEKEKVYITTEGIIFPKNIRAFSGSSEADSSEGKNLLVFVLDEADAFKNPSRSAEHIFYVCNTSARSRFQNRYKGFIISYPRSEDGFVFKLAKKIEDNIRYYFDKAATWEVLPPSKFCGETFEFEGKKIPIEFYDDFRLNPQVAKLMYMCEPSGGAENLFLNLEEIKAAFANVPRAEFVFKDIEEKQGEEILCKKDILYIPYQNIKTEFKYVIGFDLAIKEDKCALSVGHMEEDKIIIDFCTAWVPDKEKNKKVDLENVYNIIERLAGILKPVEIVGDFWNSGLLIQRLKAKGYKANVKKVTLEDYLIVKRLLINNSLFLPNNESLVNEIKNLVVDKSGEIDHLKGEHDDIFMSIIYIVKTLITERDAKSVMLNTSGEFVKFNLTTENVGFTGISQQEMEGILISPNWIIKPK